jgi:hypothetical protein
MDILRKFLLKRSNKDFENAEELILLNEKIDCLQKSVASLRKDLPSIFLKMVVDIENRRVMT